MVLEKNVFSYIPYNGLCKKCEPQGGAIFGPMGIIRTNIVEVYWVMVHTKYQAYRPCGFRQDVLLFVIFIVFHKYA